MGEKAYLSLSATRPTSHLTNVEYVLTLRLSEIQKLKKAIRVLTNAGMDLEQASNTIITAHRNRFGN